MKRAQIIVVSGLPGAGKSKVASWIAQRLSWPVLAKDDIKEALFDSLGVADAAWSKRLSMASYAVLFSMARQLARSSAPFILEGNFRWQQTSAEFDRLAPNSEFIQIWCHAPTKIVLQRLRARAADPTRHPGHRDAEFVPTLVRETVDSNSGPLPLHGELLRLDTARDIGEIERELNSFIRPIEALDAYTGTRA